MWFISINRGNQMRWIFYLAIIFTGMVLGNSLACAETTPVPDLLGNWTGSAVGHSKMDGFFEESAGAYLLVINEQQDRLFSGTLYYVYEGSDWNVDFSGGIGPDMETLYIAEYDEGFNIGKMLSPDEFEIIYIETGEKGMVGIDKFVREVTETS